MMLLQGDILEVCEDPRPKQAMRMLTGDVGPLVAIGGFTRPVAGLSYLIWVARQRARAGGILSGRPGYEADETLRGRVLSCSESVGSLREFGVLLFTRLGLSLDSMRTEDLLWWRAFSAANGSSWRSMADDATMVEALSGCALLCDIMREISAGGK